MLLKERLDSMVDLPPTQEDEHNQFTIFNITLYNLYNHHI